MNRVRGYKVFHSDWTCDPTGTKPFQYQLGKIFETNEEIKIFHQGFHFCKELPKCFEYYEFNLNNKVAEIVALGEVVGNISGDIDNSSVFCTNRIKIVRELSWEEVLKEVNIGKDNTGFKNIGNYNSGNFNVGDYNKGNFNSGFWNNGWGNTGTGNEGDSNTGFKNCGSRNTGEGNIGDRNTGDFNLCNNSTGCFNTTNYEKIRMFDKESDWTYERWYESDERFILTDIISRSNRQERWNELSSEEKEMILNLPNFDKNIFYKAIGVKVD